MLGNNGIALVFNKMNVYIFANETIKPVPIVIAFVSSLFLLLISVMSFTNGRLYCNTICPVGTFLGLISKISFYKIKINEDSCTRCGKCAKVCKSGCIDYLKKTVDISRCVSCYNCIPVCKENGIKYAKLITSKITKENHIPNPDKRKFFTQTFHSFSLVLGGTLISNSLQNTISPSEAEKFMYEIKKRKPVSPPGSFAFEHFNHCCTSCHLCVSACPAKVLQPSILEYGILGFMQPHLDFNSGFCNIECTTCSQVCPTFAIQKTTIEARKTIQMGIAKFYKEKCVVSLNNKDCGACAEHCPTKAVHMIPYKGNIKIPEVTENLCIGCGACEYMCPPSPKAIFVFGNEKHLIAEKPKEIKEDRKIDLKADFPF